LERKREATGIETDSNTASGNRNGLALIENSLE